MNIPAGSLAKMEETASAEGFADYEKMFSNEVELLKKLALSAWYPPAPSEVEEQEKKLKEFERLRELLDKEIKDIAKQDFAAPDEDLDKRIVAATVFIYLFDKVIDLHNAAFFKNKVGLYSLLDVVRDSMAKLLSDGFFDKDFTHVLEEYLDIEPRFVACAELAEVQVVAIQDAVTLYQPELAARVEAEIKGPGKKSPPTKEPEIKGPEKKSVSTKESKKKASRKPSKKKSKKKTSKKSRKKSK